MITLTSNKAKQSHYGYDSYKFFLLNQKKSNVFRLIENDADYLFISNCYLPIDFINVFTKDKKKFIADDIKKLLSVNAGKRYKRIMFFYPFAYFNPNELGFDYLDFIANEIGHDNKVLFIKNNFAISDYETDTYIYKNFNGFAYDVYNSAEKFINESRHKDVKEYKFISLNLKKRKHRVELAKFIEENNINAYFKFHPFENLKIDYNNFNSPTFFQNILKDDLYACGMADVFDKSCIYIVTEVSTDRDVIYLSEKTYKAFYHRIPFIIVGSPGSITLLKKQGFRTFHPFINEDYDNEPDYEKRMKMIQDEIKRINDMSFDKIRELLDNTQEAVIHNFDFYFNHYEERLNKEIATIL